MLEHRLAELLCWLGDHDGVSIARAAKQLRLSQSELLRLLTVLGEVGPIGGLGLISVQEQSMQRRLCLTADGRDWLARHR
jgi:hypothetical protein